MKVSILFMSLLIPSTMFSDTLTLRNNAEINGKVQYGDDGFKIDAQYGTMHKLLTFDRHQVLMLEVNSRDINPGTPPSRISTFDSAPGATKDASRKAMQDVATKDRHSGGNPPRILEDRAIAPSDDVVWLKDGKSVTGRLIKISNGKVTFRVGNEEKQIDTAAIRRVVVAPN